MINSLKFTPAIFGVALLLGATSYVPAVAAEEAGLERFAGGAATQFSDPAGAVDAFKAALAANDAEGFAKLLGLDPAKVKSAEGIMDRFAEIRDSAAKLVVVTEDGDQRILNTGREVWPFPFPLRKTADGKWAFNTQAGLEEIVNRRVGQNENTAIATAQAYVEAQRAYAAVAMMATGCLNLPRSLSATMARRMASTGPSNRVMAKAPPDLWLAKRSWAPRRSRALATLAIISAF